jgi:hypothetical protein
MRINTTPHGHLLQFRRDWHGDWRPDTSTAHAVCEAETVKVEGRGGVGVGSWMASKLKSPYPAVLAWRDLGTLADNP